MSPASPFFNRPWIIKLISDFIANRVPQGDYACIHKDSFVIFVVWQITTKSIDDKIDYPDMQIVADKYV